MAEMGNDGGGGGGGGETIDDWKGLLSSPRGNLFSGFLADGYASKSFPQIPSDFDVSSNQSVGDGGGSEGVGLEAMMKGTNNWQTPNSRIGASIAERRGVRCGFNTPRLNTARFRTVSPLSSPQYLTIPPGLSPTSLLDSPVMLSNSQAQPSPTTGTFSLPTQSVEAILSSTSNMDKDKDDDLHSSFMFKPHGDAMSLQYFSTSENRVSPAFNQIQAVEMGDTNHQMAPTQVKFESRAELLNQTVAKSDVNDTAAEGVVSLGVDPNCSPLQSYDTSAASEQAPQPEQSRLHDTESQQLQEGDKRGAPVATGRPSEDGYNWRKYGQKQVKGSVYPRSYYKCTHQNCLVKKKIERSHDGQITEIIYKGSHNHPQPQPSRRPAVGSPYSVGEMWETGEDSGSYVKVEGGSAWRSVHQGSMDNGQERTSSTSAVTEASDHLSTAQEKHIGMLDAADTPELSSTLASHDDEEDRATQGSISLGDEADDDESESKRRKKDSCISETSMASRAIREPRVVVQTHSEVDILDDGYRWRKYGQKVVKGNPNPRSYYKCTSAGCTVRKHVERASHDLKYVITTYEGKHNHEVPAARNSAHMNATGGNAPPATSSGQASLTLPRGTNVAKPDAQIAQVQDLVPRFDRKPDFSNEFFRNANLGRFASDMKLQPFQTSIPCGTFGLNAHYNGTHQAAHIAPDFGMSMPMNVPISANHAFTGYNNLGNTVIPHSFVGSQQISDTDMSLVRPKQEQKDESIFGSQLPINHLPNASASMLQQMMGGFPSQN